MYKIKLEQEMQDEEIKARRTGRSVGRFARREHAWETWGGPDPERAGSNTTKETCGAGTAISPISSVDGFA